MLLKTGHWKRLKEGLNRCDFTIFLKVVFQEHFGVFYRNLKVCRWRKGYWHTLHFSYCPLGDSVVQHFTSGFNRVALAYVMLALLALPKYTSTFSAISQILEKLIIEMHCKIYDWTKCLINTILLLSYHVLAYFLPVQCSLKQRSKYPGVQNLSYLSRL